MVIDQMGLVKRKGASNMLKMRTLDHPARAIRIIGVFAVYWYIL